MPVAYLSCTAVINGARTKDEIVDFVKTRFWGIIKVRLDYSLVIWDCLTCAPTDLYGHNADWYACCTVCPAPGGRFYAARPYAIGLILATALGPMVQQHYLRHRCTYWDQHSAFRY